jgi:N-acetylmuramoyl-L-alanine amidase
VKGLQVRLTQLGYINGGADGYYGDLTRQAVMGVQKVAGLKRDGEAGPNTWATIDAGVRPKAGTTKGHVIEVDKATQTLRVVDNGRVTWIVNASTGSGKRYTYTYKGKKHSSVALTPNADNLVFRSVKGWDDGPLGNLYAPMYFKGGIAVHGLQSVPAYADSHGCVRVSIPAMDFLRNKGLIKVGTRVLVR